jgi:hypothetical protein
MNRLLVRDAIVLYSGRGIGLLDVPRKPQIGVHGGGDLTRIIARQCEAYESRGIWIKAGEGLGYLNAWATTQTVGDALRLKKISVQHRERARTDGELLGPLACHRRLRGQRTCAAFLWVQLWL